MASSRFSTKFKANLLQPDIAATGTHVCNIFIQCVLITNSVHLIVLYSTKYWWELCLADTLLCFFPKVGRFYLGGLILSGSLYITHARIRTNNGNDVYIGGIYLMVFSHVCQSANIGQQIDLILCQYFMLYGVFGLKVETYRKRTNFRGYNISWN